MIEIPNPPNGDKPPSTKKTAKTAVPEIIPRSSSKQKKYSPLDHLIGQRLRELRILANASMQEIAVALGVSYQQLSKYEAGDNRVSAAMLYEISKIFNVQMAYFFRSDSEDAIRSIFTELSSNGIQQRTSGNVKRENPIDSEMISLIRNYYAIKNPLVRKKIYKLIKELGKEKGFKYV